MYSTLWTQDNNSYYPYSQDEINHRKQFYLNGLKKPWKIRKKKLIIVEKQQTTIGGENIQKHDCISTTFHFPRFLETEVYIEKWYYTRNGVERTRNLQSVAIAGRSGRSSAETIRAHAHAHAQYVRSAFARATQLSRRVHARTHACTHTRSGRGWHCVTVTTLSFYMTSRARPTNMPATKVAARPITIDRLRFAWNSDETAGLIGRRFDTGQNESTRVSLAGNF